MFYVVGLPTSRDSRLALLARLKQAGIIEVELNMGGWVDDSLIVSLPHLRFVHIDDAIVYALSINGSVEKYIPFME